MSDILLRGRWRAEASGRHLRAVGAPAAYRQSAAPSCDAAGAAGPVIGARGAVEAGSRRPLGLVIAGDDRTYCGVRSTPG